MVIPIHFQLPKNHKTSSPNRDIPLSASGSECAGTVVTVIARQASLSFENPLTRKESHQSHSQKNKIPISKKDRSPIPLPKRKHRMDASACHQTNKHAMESSADHQQQQQNHPNTNIRSDGGDHSSADYAPYPKLDPADVAPPSPVNATTTMPSEFNPYVTPTPAPATSKNPIETVKDVLGKWGKKMGEAAKKTEDLAGNVWQHLKTGPSVADAAIGRIAQGTKVIAEGGYEKIFRQTFDILPEEQLKKSYACYLSTSAGPVMGILYLSTAKLAFSSDNPLSYKVGDQTEWSYYKVVIPFHQLRSVNPSTSQVNAAEKYIQIVSVDNHEFWFMGFVNYDNAVKSLQDALQGAHDIQP